MRKLLFHALAVAIGFACMIQGGVALAQTYICADSLDQCHPEFASCALYQSGSCPNGGPSMVCVQRQTAILLGNCGGPTIGTCPIITPTCKLNWYHPYMGVGPCGCVYFSCTTTQVLSGC